MDVAGIPFDRAVDRAWRAQLRACKHGYYDPAGMTALVARVCADRGVQIDRDCFFNDRRAHDRQEAGGTAGEEEVRAARRLTSLRWVPPLDPRCERFFLHINDVPDTVDIRLSVDTHHICPADVEAFLHGMEEVVVEAALAPDRQAHLV
jgi:hypothetical protein